MEELEVCKRLGLQNKEELLSLLDFSDRERLINSLLKYHTPWFTREHSPTKIASRLATINVGNLYVSDGDYFRIRNHFSVDDVLYTTNGYKKGWYCIFKGKNCEVVEPGGYPSSNNFPLKNPQKTDSQDTYFETGHILARRFYKYIYTYRCTANYSVKELINNPKYNLFVQFTVANRQVAGSKRRSQAYYETLIDEYLKKGQGQIFYEVKIVFKNKSDKIPIGTELFFKTLETNQTGKKLEEITDENHVFIPNFDQEFGYSSPSSNNSEAVKEYRDFYSNGYSEKFKSYFSNAIFTEQQQQYFLVINGKINGIFVSLELARQALGMKSADYTSFRNLQFSNRYEKRIYTFAYEDVQDVESYLLKNGIVSPTGKKNNLFYPTENYFEIPGIYFDFKDVAKQSRGYRSAEPCLSNALDRIPIP